MSRYHYEQSKLIAMKDYGFTPLLMALMRKADTENAAKLEAAFPEKFAELKARYDAPGGIIEGDPDFGSLRPEPEAP